MNETWELLHSEEKLLDPARVAAHLSALGVCNGRDLLYCEDAELYELASCMKKVPQRRFFQLVGLHPDGSGRVVPMGKEILEDQDEGQGHELELDGGHQEQQQVHQPLHEHIQGHGHIQDHSHGVHQLLQQEHLQHQHQQQLLPIQQQLQQELHLQHQQLLNAHLIHHDGVVHSESKQDV